MALPGSNPGAAIKETRTSQLTRLLCLWELCLVLAKRVGGLGCMSMIYSKLGLLLVTSLLSKTSLETQDSTL